MQTFVWGEEFYTGICLVDEQHRGLLDLFNRLSDTLVSQGVADSVAVEAVFRELMAYAAEHFSVEERLMRDHAIHDRHVKSHVGAHSEFVGQVRSMWESRASIGNPGEAFHAFLTSWLCLHVLGTDMSLARQLAAIDKGQTPLQAYEQELQRPREKGSEAMLAALRNTFRILSRLSLDLIDFNRQLEERVLARTAELQQANEALKVANQKLEVYSQTDGLLGISNRAFFDVRLRDEWNRAIREQAPIGLLMIDVDFFKKYNDHYGHPAGDACLQAVARAAAGKMVRAIDLLARYGGEEFVVILPNTVLTGAQKVAEGICEAVAALNIPHAASAAATHVTVSIGAASLLPDRNESPDSLVAASDRALYVAKQQGRNRVCLAD